MGMIKPECTVTTSDAFTYGKANPAVTLFWVSMASGATFSETMACGYCDWLDVLLAGISAVVRIGSPGVLQVYGDQAHPVLVSGTGTSGDVIIVAAELGAGRVVVATQGAYVSGIEGTPPPGKKKAGAGNAGVQTLQENIKRWLLKNDTAEPPQIQTIDNVKHVGKIQEKTNLLVHPNGHPCPEKVENDVIAFVKNGGALVYGVAPWGWLQTQKGKATLQNIPFAKLLGLIGVTFTGKIAARAPQYDVTKAHAARAHKSHMGHMIKECLFDATALANSGFELSKTILNMPQVVMDGLGDMWAAFFAQYDGKIQKSLPGPKTPIKDPLTVSLLKVYNALAIRGQGEPALPGIERFPGTVPENALKQLTSMEVTVTAHCRECHPLGVYAVAGQQVTVTIIRAEGPAAADKWAVVVGAQSDKLYNKPLLRRWPQLRFSRGLPGKVGGRVSMKSPMGGLIYLESPQTRATVTVKVENVLEAPLYDVTRPETVAAWEGRRKAPGPWADVAGRYVRFTLPSASVRQLGDPAATLALWDRILAAYHDLRGTRVAAQKREWFMPDPQPSAGYMHSGYPIVTHMDVAGAGHPNFLLKKDTIEKTGRWGAFHELGHNMQRGMWTPSGFIEVTCNIFSLLAMETAVVNYRPWMGEKRLARVLPRAKQYLLSLDEEKVPKDPNGWRQNNIALLEYGQLIHHLTWEAFRATFSHYKALPRGQRPQRDADRIDQWVIHLSTHSGYDLRPFYTFWGWPMTSKVDDALRDAGLPYFLPTDEVTRLVPERLEAVKQQFQGRFASPPTPPTAMDAQRSECDESNVIQSTSGTNDNPDNGKHDEL